jgi:hypothetical protein
MDWELVLREQGKRDDVRLVSEEEMDPNERLYLEGRVWRYIGEESTGNPAAPVRVFYGPS